MSIFSMSRSGLLSIATILLLVLNSILLMRDYQSKIEVTNLRSRLHDTLIKNRVFESEAIFGNTFIPRFNITDLTGNVVDLPYWGRQDMLIMFFKSSDCRACLENMKVYEERVSNVPIVGVALEGSLSEVKQIKQEFGYEFSVFKALDSSFQMNQSPNSVLIDRNRNILSLSKIDPGSESVEESINQIIEVVERR